MFNWRAVLILSSMAILFLGCGEKPKEEIQMSMMPVVSGSAQLDSVLVAAGGSMVVLDLYADWCMPCRVLAPTLEELAQSYKGKARFYRINVDHNPAISRDFGVRGIPYVVFMRNKQVIYALTGLNPKDQYERVILTCGSANSAEECVARMNDQ